MRPQCIAAPLLTLVVASLLLPNVGLGQCDHPRFTFCPEETLVYECDAGSGPEAVVNYPTPIAVDDCGPAYAFLYSGPPSGATLQSGSYDVEWRTLENENGDYASCFFRIVVAWRPTIECPKDTTVRACDPGGAFVNYALPRAYDDCGPIFAYPTEGPGPGGFFPIGTTRVVWRTNEDNHGSYEECSFYVTVEWPRTLVCPEDTTVTICPGPSGTSVNYSLPQAFDDCGPIEVELEEGPPPGAFFPVGVTHVTYRTERDAQGIALYCTFHVFVEAEDHDPPTIACPGDINAVVDPGQTSVPVTYDIEAVDDCPGTVTVVCDPPSGSLFPCGTTRVTCRATDANLNTSECRFSVNVGVPVSIDVRPGFCPNPFQTSEKGLVPVAIHGTRLFDVTQVDPASVKLEGISPVRWSVEDVGAPYEPYIGKDGCLDCGTSKKDRIRDLVLKFDGPALAAALDIHPTDDCRFVHLSGLVAGGCPIVGEDAVKVLTAQDASLGAGAADAATGPPSLSATSPNPFSPGNRIEYSLPRSGRARLVIYDVLGRIVTTLVDREHDAGTYSLAWDGKDRTGARATSGLYFYVLTVSSDDGAGTLSQRKKLVLSR